MRAAVYGRESQGKKKSIDDQLDLGHHKVGAEGWTLAGSYSDKVSASRFGKHLRGGWAEVREAVKSADAPDVLILWESSRGDRTPGTWIDFLNDCRAGGVRIHLLSEDETYDPRKARHMKYLSNAGVDSAFETDVLSERVRRGMERAALQGLPPGGVCPYGYRRVYDQMTGALVGQEPDPVTAPVAAEIIRRVSESDPCNAIARDLDTRGIPAPGDAKSWYGDRIRVIALNRTYLGERKHHETWHAGSWPALVDPETFAAAGRVLAAPGRRTHGPTARPGKQTHLLTGYAECWKAGCDRKAGAREAAGGTYRCLAGHYAIKRGPVDELIRDLAVARLSDPEVYAALKHDTEAANEEAEAARAEVVTLTADLEEYRRLARQRKITPASFAEIEPGLVADIEAAAAKADAATVPADLAGWTGPEEDVRARWEAANVNARRVVLRALRLRITFLPALRNPYADITGRVDVKWNRPQQ